MTRWHTLGDPHPTALVEARLGLHFAAQVPAAVGQSLLAPEPEYAHLGFAWDERLVGLVTPAVDGRRAGLRLPDATVVVLAGREIVDRLPLAGRTVAEGLAWLSARFGRPLAAPDHELPEHALGGGARFGSEGAAARAELARWFANADELLQGVRRAQPGAAPVRTWPHHFDIATLITRRADPDPERAASINVGMSPGDDSYAEPYLYVVPWPAPPVARLRPLPCGHWHTEGWIAAILTGSELVGGEHQDGRAETFVRAAITACDAFLA